MERPIRQFLNARHIIVAIGVNVYTAAGHRPGAVPAHTVGVRAAGAVRAGGAVVPANAPAGQIRRAHGRRRRC